MAKNTSELVLYQTDDGQTKIQVRLENETVWLTQAQMVELFQTTKQNVSLHMRNIFAERELSEDSVVKESLTTASDGKNYATKYYNLDAIIAVGYRVKSHRGTQFRIWATERLREYIVKGFTLDDERLKESGASNAYFDELLERIRDIRTSEKNFYHKVREIYKMSADYESSTQVTQEFYATIQNKFHWAIHHHTAAELIAERANATKPSMGLTNWKGSKIRKTDITVAKNYLSLDELKQLNLLVEQYLSFAESQALQRKVMYMNDWVAKLHDILTINEREILRDAGKISAKLAEERASKEFERFQEQERKIDALKETEELASAVKKLKREKKKR